MDKNKLSQLRTGDPDINNQQLFFGIFMKALIYDLNHKMTIRGIKVDHFILNTGDDIMYLERKGVDQSKEPLEQTNEDYIYNTVPRCMVTPKGISLLTDQLTSPYTKGTFQYEDEEGLHQLLAEYRRMPFRMGIGLKYYFNSFTDTLECMQQLVSKFAFINNFSMSYLGQTLLGTYKLPDTIDDELMMQFDGLTQDSKYRSIEIELDAEGNIPIIQCGTITSTDTLIRNFQVNVHMK